MLFQYDPLPDDKKFLECAVCLEPWTDPKEVDPCAHIFCSKCLNSVGVCPMCRDPIQGLRQPNRVLVQLAVALPGRCTSCSWRGSWEQFEITRHASTHVSSSGSAAGTLATAPAVHDNASSLDDPDQTCDSLALPPWEEYGIAEAEYYLIKSAVAAAQRSRRMAASAGNGRNGAGDPKLSVTMTLDEARIFARLMGYPSGTPDLLSMFEEFGAVPTDVLSEHHLLLWASTTVHKRRSECKFGMTEVQYLAMLNDLHESVDFKRLAGVLTTPHHVAIVRQCRSLAMGAASVGSEVAEDKRVFHTVLQGTRKRQSSCGYPADGILLVDALEAIASVEEGFELCDPASPRAPPTSSNVVATQQQQQQQQSVLQDRSLGPRQHAPSVSARAGPYYAVSQSQSAGAPVMYYHQNHHRQPQQGQQQQPYYYQQPYPMQQPRYAPQGAYYGMPPQHGYYYPSGAPPQQVGQSVGGRGGSYPPSIGARTQQPPQHSTPNGNVYPAQWGGR